MSSDLLLVEPCFGVAYGLCRRRILEHNLRFRTPLFIFLLFTNVQYLVFLGHQHSLACLTAKGSSCRSVLSIEMCDCAPNATGRSIRSEFLVVRSGKPMNGAGSPHMISLLVLGTTIVSLLVGKLESNLLKRLTT